MIKVLRLTSVRCLVVRDNSENLVLEVSAGGEKFNFGLSVSELRKLSEQLSTDSRLISTKDKQNINN